MDLNEQYKIAIDLLEKESDRFWSRNNVFLIIQAAFISFYVSTVNENYFYSIILSTQGLILAYIWIGILIKGARYVTRWDTCVRVLEKKILEKKNNDEFIGLKLLNDQAKINESNLGFPLNLIDKRTTVLIRYLIYSLLIFWLIILVISIIYFFNPKTETEEVKNLFHLLTYYGN